MSQLEAVVAACTPEPKLRELVKLRASSVGFRRPVGGYVSLCRPPAN
jgi:hypothetical protein